MRVPLPAAMMTTWSDMRLFLARSAIIGVMFLLSGCSALRLGYDQGPTLAWWWLDGYADFRSDQAPRAKEAIRQWFAWHRTAQLPGYAAWLAALRGRIGESVTAAQVCRWNDEVRQQLAPAIDRALVLGAPLAAALGEAELRHLEQRYAKGNDELKRDHLQPDRAERLAASVKRTVERAEGVYGRLDDTQLELIRAGVAASPFDPEAWLAERQRRQRDTLATLRRLTAEQADADRLLPALRALAERTERSDDPAYRAYQRRLTDYNCAFVARLHNATTPAQRQKAQEKLEGWEGDLRALAAQAAAAPPAPAPGQVR